MGRIILSFPTKFFNDKFIESIAKNGLGVSGDDLPQYLKEKVNKEGRLFNRDIMYCCKSVHNNVILVGTNIN